jgi:hypothetical protein
LRRSQIRIKEIQYFLTQKTNSKFSKIRSGLFIPDPGSGFFPSRIPDPDPGVKKHRIPDPDPQHWENESSMKRTFAEIYSKFTSKMYIGYGNS